MRRIRPTRVRVTLRRLDMLSNSRMKSSCQEMGWNTAHASRMSYQQPLPRELSSCSPRLARWPRQVFGLMGVRRSRRPGLLDAASQVRKDPVLEASFVPNYRCGTAPEWPADPGFTGFPIKPTSGGRRRWQGHDSVRTLSVSIGASVGTPIGDGKELVPASPAGACNDDCWRSQ